MENFNEWFNKKKAEFLRLNYTGQCGFDECETLYHLIRAFKPKVVVETGVNYGASTANILQALAENKSGKLYSIDKKVDGFFIHKDLKERWVFIKGNVKDELPKLLERLGEINFFFHDSSHNPKHMNWEYTTVIPYLKGLLTSHDIKKYPDYHWDYAVRGLGICLKQGIAKP